MENISAPVSPKVVDTIFMTQYKKTMLGTLFFKAVFTNAFSLPDIELKQADYTEG